MPLLPVQPPDAPFASSELIAQRFNELATEWQQATGHLSSMSAACRHPAYQEIIGLGSAVLPLLLRDLELHETHWFIALKQLTHADPVPPAAAGNIPKMVEAWLSWAKDQGYQ